MLDVRENKLYWWAEAPGFHRVRAGRECHTQSVVCEAHISKGMRYGYRLSEKQSVPQGLKPLFLFAPERHG